MSPTPSLVAHHRTEHGASSHHISNGPQMDGIITSTSYSPPFGSDTPSLNEHQDDDMSDIEPSSHHPGQFEGVSKLPQAPIPHHTFMAGPPVAASSLPSSPSSSQGNPGNYSHTVDQADDTPASSNSGLGSPSSVTPNDGTVSENDGDQRRTTLLYPSSYMELDPVYHSLQSNHVHHLADLEMDETGADEGDTESDSAAGYEAAMQVLHSYPPDLGPHHNLNHLIGYGDPAGMPSVPEYSLGGTYHPLEMPVMMDPSLSFPGAPPVAPGEEDLPPILLSSGSAETTGSQNYGLLDFLRYWSRHRSLHAMRDPTLPIPNIHCMMEQINRRVTGLSYSDLNGDKCDMQGLDWDAMGVTRDIARITRKSSYKNYVNIRGSDSITATESDTFIPPSESYFRYRRTIMRSDVHLSHFQLRSVLACPSRSQVYYATRRGINRLNPVAKKADLAMNVRYLGAPERTVTALDASSEVLVGGTFNGDYCIKSVHAEDTQTPSEGQITGDSAITTHIQIHTPRRSSSPIAAIASNDNGLRMLDLVTEQFISESFYDSALNCSAISPDRRLRVLVGDTPNISIINADTGAVEVTLRGHRDYGFACDWSDDGVTVATGFQDRRVKIWDARKWTDSNGNGTPIMSILCEMSSARSLKFSPLGSGAPVLVAAEEADYINIIDAKTFRKKQTFDIFGEIGGVAFAEESQELNVLVSDTRRGGLIQFDRCGRLQSSQWAHPRATLQYF